MDKCPNCGNKLSKIDVLCPRCGSVVEVIQIKGNMSVASEAVAVGKSNKDIPVQKKEFPQNFIVYNEDFPTEDTGDAEPAIAPSMPFSDISENAVSENAVVTDLSSDSDSDIDFDFNQSSVNSIQAKLLEMESSEEKNSNNVNDISFTEKNASETSGEDDNDYSPRYLEKIRNLNLPEIEDINNFDPEEYMREYKYRKIVSKQSEEANNDTPAKKHWLEIEEADALEANLESVREDGETQRRFSEQPAPQTVERRYRGVQESRTEINRDLLSAERKKPAKNKKRVKYSALSTILFWVIVSAVLIFGCIFFDNYVKTSFGTYDSFIYTITNGQIDIDTNNP